MKLRHCDGAWRLACWTTLFVFPAAAACPQDDAASAAPQMCTSARLLKLGESISFQFRCARGEAPGTLAIFARYLEQARPNALPSEGGDLRWLDALNCETIPIRLKGPAGSVAYTPRQVGNYMARWTIGGEELYRHFAAVESDSVVATFSTFEGLDPEMTLHGVGIPLDFRLPVERFHGDDLLLRKFLAYHRRYGETIVPVLPDMPDAPSATRLERYRDGLQRVRAFFPDPQEVRSARVEMHHDLDPGYTDTLAALGVNEHCGMWEANAKPWLGMPEFPYFASSTDCRKARQAPGGAVVAHQWDFCGGWHFFGPVSWHYKASRGDWTASERCLRMGLDEFRELARMSGHPAFVTPLYDGLAGPGYPNPAFQYAQREPRTFRGWVEDAFVSFRAMDAFQIARVMGRGPSEAPAPTVGWPPKGELSGNCQWVKGRAGKALRLDGLHGCFTADRPAVVDGTEFTIGCWVKPEATQQTWANILSSHKSLPDGACRGVSLEQSGDHANRYYLLGGVGKQWLGTGITTQLKSGVWQHFAVSRRGRTLTHYLNGAVSVAGDVGDATFAPSGEPWRIGDWARGDVATDPAMRDFVDRYRRFAAFEATKQYKLVYTRSLDIADYYRRHFQRTPRTVFVSATDHLAHDKWWLCHWCNLGTLVTKDRIAWDTRIAEIMEPRRKGQYFKDPLSLEYVLVEDHRRSLRFERESPNPVWWFDYTKQEKGPKGSGIAHTETPDVQVRRTAWVREGNCRRTILRMHTTASMPDYAVAIWDLPKEFQGDRAKVRTSAKEFVVAWNRDKEYRLILFFDLAPDAELSLSFLD